jgi:hypothetical protein
VKKIIVAKPNGLLKILEKNENKRRQELQKYDENQDDDGIQAFTNNKSQKVKDTKFNLNINVC